MRLSFLSDVYTQPGPFVSVYLDTSRDTAEAEHEIGVRWRDARRELADDGAPAADLDAIESAIPDLRGVGPTGHAVFATGGRVVLAAELEGPPRRPVARYSPLPHAMPLVAQTREAVPHVLVVMDRVGADITVVGKDGEQIEEKIEGKTYPIRKVQAGGWSHRRFQERAENTWEQNAAQVAKAVVDAVRTSGAEVVLVTGEERARAELLHALADGLQAEVVEVPGGSRHPGADQDAFMAEVDKLLADRVAVRATGRVAKFREEIGQHDRAAEGLAAAIAALQRAQVETLFVNDDPTADGTLFVGPEPEHLALTREELVALGVDEPAEDRVDAALVRAATRTEAEIVLITQEELSPADGVGAILRYRLPEA